MGTINKPNTFTNGTSADADQVNANFDTLYTEINGKLDDSNMAQVTLSQADATAKNAAWLTGKPVSLLCRVVTLVKTLMGTANVYDAVPIDLSTVKSKFDALDGEWMEFSSTLGNHTSSTFGYNASCYAGNWMITVPKGKILRLKKARYSIWITNTFKLQIEVSTDDGDTFNKKWESTNPTAKGVDAAPDLILYDNTSGSAAANVLVRVMVQNTTFNDSFLYKHDTYWLLLHLK